MKLRHSESVSPYSQVSLLACLCVLSLCAQAQSPDDVVVTATRIPEPEDRIPAAISVVSGNGLSARGATDMAGALALVAGVEAPPGGDAGPSSAVPAFWGLHEFDAFLLVVDGVPWGGALNPSITTLRFNDVQRLEVLKGAAPVMYGATSFVGVVQAIHYPAGEAANELDIAFGTYGSVRGWGSIALPQLGGWRQSLAVDGQDVGFADAREAVSDKHILYRGELDAGAGKLRVDAELTLIRDVPQSPVLRVGSLLTNLTPPNANFNPADARIEQNQYHLALGYSLPTALGDWEMLGSFAYSDITDIRAFLHPDLSGTADTQHQRRYIADGYFDTHLAHALAADTTLLVGADLLYGHGQQTMLNVNDAFTVPLDGSVLPPATSSVTGNEVGTINDRRWFSGAYAQLDWKPDERWDLLAGVRLNATSEHKDSSDLDLLTPPEPAAASVRKSLVRPSETLGVSYRIWAEDRNQLVGYADYRNAFKPSAIDFGPDYTPDLLSPETARSYEAGLKGTAIEGLLSYQTELFWLDFQNLVIATSSGALANAGGERLKGIESEARYQATTDLTLAASVSYHDARFTHYQFFDGASDVDVGGKQLILSPHWLAGMGLLYTPKRGINAAVIARYVGRRFLDEENVATLGSYATLDANLGYAWDRWRVSIDGTNLTNQRPPVTSSEFGSQSFYLLPARMLWLRVGYSWR